ncbi:MAG: SGNH/GDSL hydrolase family protein [Steroidobacteraceae bacterium]|nr:SGNH/GDSL hydrolase family protein [Steroidobacteraceae bacterium]
MNMRNSSGLAKVAGGLRRIALAMVLVTAATAASANPPAARGNDGYLALGDSVVFGYITAAGYAWGNAMNFLGYPDYIGANLRFSVANASCPGETTSGFINANGPDNGCRPYRANFPLHVNYPTTQLDYAVSYLKSHKQTRLVTIGLGANDAFLLQSACGGDIGCIQAGLPTLLGTIYGNMSLILQNLRATGYRGVIIVANYYSTDYTDPVQTGFTVAINQYLAAAADANGAVVADVFAAFQNATLPAGGKTCVAGLLNTTPANAGLPPPLWTCDVHPSLSGQQLLARTVAQTYSSVSRSHK